jgi:superfamily I DNA and/or RNA helicase
MDFLETDFHKRRNPKRSIKLRNSENLLLSLKTAKYPRFESLMFKERASAFQKDKFINVQKGVYKSDIPTKVLELIELQVSKIKKKDIADLQKDVAFEIEKAATVFSDDREQGHIYAIEKISDLFRERVTKPFIEHIAQPILNADLGDENSIFLAEEELTSVLVSGIEDKASELINLTIVGDTPNIPKSLGETFNYDFVCEAITDFFSQYQVGDLYSELFEIDRNRGILDKQEFYYYFYDITFRKTKYPVFYIPLFVSREKDVFRIEFDSQIYVNKKALEFIVQENNAENGLRGTLQTIKERIIYLAEGESKVLATIESILSEIEGAFELTSVPGLQIDSPLISKSKSVQVSNASYIALFDKSDEALVNDYEEILQGIGEGEAGLTGMFEALVADFIDKEPEVFISEVESEWRDKEPSEKLVYKSPIPLNSEQRQIVAALKRDRCKYVTVEGPPGTGKSHTITAILFDAVLDNQSVLVLSDKKEALDVVEDKIVSTLKSVRNSDNFQNPILRLGKAGSNYAKILSPQSITSIKNYHNALRDSIDDVESTLTQDVETLKEDIDAEISGYSDIDINDIVETEALHKEVSAEADYLLLDELVNAEDGHYDLENLYTAVGHLKWFVESDDFHQLKQLLALDTTTDDLASLRDSLLIFAECLEIVGKHVEQNEDLVLLAQNFDDLTSSDVETLLGYQTQLQELKQPLVGYFFTSKKVSELRAKYEQKLGVLKQPAFLEDVAGVARAVQLFSELETELANTIKVGQTIDLVNLAHYLLVTEDVEIVQGAEHLAAKFGDIWVCYEYPKFAEGLGISNCESISNILGSKINELSEVTLKKAMAYIELSKSLATEFQGIEVANYFSKKREIEKNTALQMTNILDSRLISFTENNRATATAIREIITKKGRFPKKEFEKLKDAFPCILAGIRDYAEYIPLEPEIFDLVIIDEASQVSVAQAFPALLRAKKVLIFGDRKQFSNVKATQARSDTNREYLNTLESSFRKNVSSEPDKLVKLGKFNIKTSILEFFEYINNYNIQLTKHFRGYKELISYSNKYFYGSSLEVMKIRSKAISDVIEFTLLEYGEDVHEPYHNSNLGEVEFVISKLLEMHEKDLATTVGIITPHTNQQRLFAEKINALPESEFFYNKLNLKIMTFDTCQGEERDVVFYSMVANTANDRLWGIFIKNLASIDVEEDGKIKAQRLNVGFSRAKEKMHFVISKPLDMFDGAIREALYNYHYQLENAQKEYTANDTDSRSAMEPMILNWFYQTEFWQKADKNDVQFIPQFELGSYLKQLDVRYEHPAYVVDFLLVYKDEKAKEHKIIIEYDGFQEHFANLNEVNEFNFEDYYNENDVYRQKVLEGYGYQFLRVNKFNIGNEPIIELDTRLNQLIKGITSENALVSRIREKADGLSNGEMKKCPRCEDIRPLGDFKDSSLITGVGKVCADCKKTRKREQITAKPKAEPDENVKCPRCNSPMFHRKGRYGSFYGCSRYPRCRGTRRA